MTYCYKLYYDISMFISTSALKIQVEKKTRIISRNLINILLSIENYLDIGALASCFIAKIKILTLFRDLKSHTCKHTYKHPTDTHSQKAILKRVRGF